MPESYAANFEAHRSAFDTGSWLCLTVNDWLSMTCIMCLCLYNAVQYNTVQHNVSSLLFAIIRCSSACLVLSPHFICGVVCLHISILLHLIWSNLIFAWPWLLCLQRGRAVAGRDESDTSSEVSTHLLSMLLKPSLSHWTEEGQGRS